MKNPALLFSNCSVQCHFIFDLIISALNSNVSIWSLKCLWVWGMGRWSHHILVDLSLAVDDFLLCSNETIKTVHAGACKENSQSETRTQVSSWSLNKTQMRTNITMYSLIKSTCTISYSRTVSRNHGGKKNLIIFRNQEILL